MALKLLKKPLVKRNFVSKIVSAVDRMVDIANKFPGHDNENADTAHETIRSILASKIATACGEIERGGSLEGRSLYLLTDIYRLSAYLYENCASSLVCDGDWDKIARFLLDNKAALKKYGVIPGVIDEEDLATTGMGVQVSAADIDLAHSVALLRSAQHADGVNLMTKEAKTDGYKTKSSEDGGRGHDRVRKTNKPKYGFVFRKKPEKTS